MVEGHGVHRVAERHKRLLLGKVFKATSPNGKFKEGAKLINNRPLSRIEAIGKNLFYFWGNGKDAKNATVVHIHFGMSGQFKTGSALEATPNTRLELIGSEGSAPIMAHLSAMTCVHGDVDFYEKKKRALGEDPLREDADKYLVWEAFRKSRKSVGLLLMDQTVIAGLGNIYRAEVLFKAGIHPEQPGNTISKEAFDRIWDISKDLLFRGFQTGSILTVDPEENLPPPWTRRYIYNHSTCGRCGSSVRTWDMAARKCYACPTCQTLTSKGTASLSEETRSKLKKAKEHVPFMSHCAPEPKKSLSDMTVKALKEMLVKHDLPLNGKKADLIERLEACPDFKRAQAKPTQVEQRAKPASAFDAALEKINAGEKRNVEHIALVEESSMELGKLSTMTVKSLKEELKNLNLSTAGNKQELIKRLASTLVKKEEKTKSKPVEENTGRIPFRQSKRRKQ